MVDVNSHSGSRYGVCGHRGEAVENVGPSRQPAQPSEPPCRPVRSASPNRQLTLLPEQLHGRRKAAGRQVSVRSSLVLKEMTRWVEGQGGLRMRLVGPPSGSCGVVSVRTENISQQVPTNFVLLHKDKS